MEKINRVWKRIIVFILIFTMMCPVFSNLELSEVHAGNCGAHVVGYSCPGNHTYGSHDSRYQTCTSCGGSGVSGTYYICIPCNIPSLSAGRCPNCRNAFTKLESNCSRCGGNGRLWHCARSGCSQSAYTIGGPTGSCNAQYSCSGCVPITGDHVGGGATCTTSNNCIYCGGMLSGALGHSTPSAWDYTTSPGYHVKFCARGCGTRVAGPDANTYYVAYNAGGGTGSMGKQTLSYGTSYNLSANLFGKTGYSFSKWSGSNGKSYGNKASISNLTTTNNGTVTMTAQWSAKSYTLSFHPNGGTCTTANKSVTYDSTYGSLPTPTRTGYTFLGWYTAASGGTQVNTGTKVTTASNHSIYAQWKINSYQVTYNVNGGDSISKNNATVVYNTNVDLNPTATKEGYIFIGWNTSSSAKEGLASLVMGAGNITLYAIYSIPVSNVKELYVQAWENGNTETYRTYALKRTGESVRGYNYTLPATNLATGFSNAANVSFRILAWDYAQNWSVIKTGENPPEVPQWYLQTVEHYKYDETLGDWVKFDAVSEYKLKGETYEPKYVQTPVGYRNDTIDAAYVVEADKVSKAYYKPLDYTLHFDANGGTCEVASKKVYYNKVYGELPTPTKEGHTFLGWFTEKEVGEQRISSDIYTIAGDSTLYAHWKANIYTVYYDYATNGGTSASKESVEVPYGKSIDLSVKAFKDGYEHIGWSLNPDSTEGTISITMGDDNVYLYAIYRKKLTATFIDKNDEGIQTRKDSVVVYNRESKGSITVPVQNEWSEWSKQGWSLNLEADAIPDTTDEAIYYLTEDATFYGLYEKPVKVTYDTNGTGTEIPEQVETRYYSASNQFKNPSFVLADAPERSYHSFVNWVDEEKKEHAAGEVVTLEEDMHYVAKWDKYPEIEAYDRYFTLEQAQNGEITETELLKKVIGTDLEDGLLENGTSVVVIHHNPEEYKQFTTTGSASATYQATDSFGNQTTKLVNVHIIDTGLKEARESNYIRYIDSKYYKNGSDYISADKGGLEATSIWKTNEVYGAALDYAMSNTKSNKEIVNITFLGKDYAFKRPGSGTWSHKRETWEFSKEQIKEMDQFLDVNGFGRYLNPDGTDEFYNQFSECKK